MELRLTRSELVQWCKDRIASGEGAAPMVPYTVEGDAGTEIYVLQIPA